MSQPVHNRTYLKDRRIELRNRLTPAEASLWKILKNGGLKDRKFRRQHSIENYIVDFYCPSERLIIELDGAVHRDPIQSVHDEERTKRQMELGNKVLRFENRLVFEEPLAVVDEIEKNFGWLV
jgi:very-short-patch-repair endonuclease